MPDYEAALRGDVWDKQNHCQNQTRTAAGQGWEGEKKNQKVRAGMRGITLNGAWERLLSDRSIKMGRC